MNNEIIFIDNYESFDMTKQSNILESKFEDDNFLDTTEITINNKDEILSEISDVGIENYYIKKINIFKYHLSYLIKFNDNFFIERRFNDFFIFNSILNKKFFFYFIPSIPEKELINIFLEDKIEKRINRLNYFLKFLIKSKNNNNNNKIFFDDAKFEIFKNENYKKPQNILLKNIFNSIKIENKDINNLKALKVNLTNINLHYHNIQSSNSKIDDILKQFNKNYINKLNYKEFFISLNESIWLLEDLIKFKTIKETYYKYFELLKNYKAKDNVENKVLETETNIIIEVINFYDNFYDSEYNNFYNILKDKIKYTLEFILKN